MYYYVNRVLKHFFLWYLCNSEPVICNTLLAMKNKSLFAAALLVILFACDDDNGDNPIAEKTSLLTLTVDASYPTVNSDHWIMVHGEDGSLLTSNSFENGQELEIVTEKPVPGKITVTHLWYSLSNGTKYYFASTHSNIEKGKHMILKSNSATASAITGKINVAVSNVADYDHFSLSSRLGAAFSLSWASNTDILELNSPTHAGVSKYIVTLFSGNSLRQKVLNNVTPNSNHSFSFNEMDPFDHTVDFTFSPTDNVALYVSGSEPDAALSPNNYSLITHFQFHAHNTIKAGYLTSLTNYKTRLTITYPDFGYEYINIGSIPDGNIAWPQKSDFDINEKSFTNFSATASKSYVWRYSTWGYSDGASQTSISWNVSALSGNQSIQELPTEITNVHPELSLSNLKHAATTFYTQSPTFESVLNTAFESGSETAGVRLGIRIITK